MKQIKELILEKTFLLLLEKGYERISVSDIHQGLGISRGLLYRYFKGKDDLVEKSCLKYFVERFLLSNKDLDELTFLDSLLLMHERMISLLVELEQKCEHVIAVTKYNMLYADIVMRSESFKKMAYSEFAVAKDIIDKAKAKGQIKKEFTTDFILNASFDILARVTSPLDNEDLIRLQMLSDLCEFYEAIKIPQTAE